MFVILTEHDTLFSECACQCVEYKINHTLIKKNFLALNIAICWVAYKIGDMVQNSNVFLFRNWKATPFLIQTL